MDRVPTPKEDVMNHWTRLVPLSMLFAIFFVSPAARAQAAKSEAKKPSRAIVSLYRVAPGKQLDFLKWMAENDAIDKEAGVPASYFYVHTDGDSWDYMGIAPVLTEEQQAKVDEIDRKHGRKVGFQAGLQFRTLVASHTDTFTIGPVSAAELVMEAGK
jgi:hypothetical protein